MQKGRYHHTAGQRSVSCTSTAATEKRSDMASSLTPNGDRNSMATTSKNGVTPPPLGQHHTDAAASNEFELIDEVEWGPRKDEEGYDTDQELAPRPRRKPAGEDMCGCFPPKTGLACLDESCILYACREECRSNCLAGSVCGNKRMQRKEFANVEVFDAGPKGKGLRLSLQAKQLSVKGDILCEYTGRAIREAALSRLFRRYQLDRRLYIMALEKGVFLDARQKGGIARYINHSCRPNCKVELWTVKGVLRAAVVAMNATIQPGEELTFDYQWERKRGRAPTVCHCGVPECRGTLEMSKSLEDQDLARELECHWEAWPSDDEKAGETVVNRAVQVFSKENNEYFLGEVTGYDVEKELHCIFYQHDKTEVWEDLSKEKWMILNETADKEHFIIAKKVHSRRFQPEKTTLLTTASAEVMGRGSDHTLLPSKNYVYTQSPIKEALWAMHLIERCQRNCNVQIEAEQMARPPVPPDSEEDVEKFAALDRSLDGTVWKLSITGVDVPRACNILQKNLAFLEKKFAQDEIANSVALAGKAAAAAVRPLDTSIPPSNTDIHEVIFPRHIADLVKRRIQTVREKCRSVNIVFAASDSKSKQFSKIILEGTLLSDIENAKELLWVFLVELCSETNAPKKPNNKFVDLGFLGGALSKEHFELLVSKNDKPSSPPKARKPNLNASEDLNCSSFVMSFESANQCAIWIQVQDDQGRVNSSNVVVNEASADTARKVYFGCKPSDVKRLGAFLQSRAQELARGVKYIHLGSDRVYLKLMKKSGDVFFDFVKRLTGATSVDVDPITGDHVRIDGKLSQSLGQKLPMLVSEWTDCERASLAAEIIRVQIECYRDACVREYQWHFGRDWALNSVFVEDITSSSSQKPAIGILDRSTVCYCGMEIADTVANLGLQASVAGHATVILYRFVCAHQEFSSQVKTREAVLACVFLANKAQKSVKWKKLEAVLEAGYEVFYPGSKFDKVSEEVAVLEERVLLAEAEILQAVQYDLFWKGTEWIAVTAKGSGKMSDSKVQAAFNFTLSGPVLGAGAELWLKYGIEYIFAASSAFLQISIDDLLPALSLIPLKVSQAAQLLSQTVKYGRPMCRSTPTHPLVEKEDGRLEKLLPELERRCINLMTDRVADVGMCSQVENRYRIIGQQSSLCYAIRGVPIDHLKNGILPILDRIATESACSIHVSTKWSDETGDILLSGVWRAVALADHLLRSEGGTSIPLPSMVVASTDNQDYPNEKAKSHPGLLSSTGLITTDGWQGTIQAIVPYDDLCRLRIGGKSCLPGKISVASLQQSGLRWWVPPEHGHNVSGSILDASLMKSNPDRQMELLAHLASLTSVNPDEFPILLKQTMTSSMNSSERFIPVSLQRWPPLKVAGKESKMYLKSEPRKMGFSVGALQEMQLMKELHSIIPSPKGHPNFILPICIACPDFNANTERTREIAIDGDDDDDKSIGSPHDPIYSLLRTNGEIVAATQETKIMDDCASIVFQATPFILQRFLSRTLRTQDAIAITPSIISAWFHDILSALVHCHSNHVIFRTILTDQMVVDQCGVLKVGSLYRATVMSHKEREKAPSLRGLAKSLAKKNKGKKRKIEEDDAVISPYDAPEILLGIPNHSKESDIWTVGCILAHLLVNKPVFTGKDRSSLLLSQYKVVGAPMEGNFVEAIEFPNYSKPEKRYKRGVDKALEKLMKDQVSHHQQAINLISRMLHLDPKKRCTAAEALSDDYLSEYSENCQSDAFRQQFVSDWIDLKKRTLQPTEKDIRSMAEIKARKRIKLASSNISTPGDDDLYDMNDFLVTALQK